MLKTQTYSLNKLLLTNEVLSLYINNFWIDVFSKLDGYENKHLMLMCKVEFESSDMGHRSLGHLRRVNFDDKELFIDYLIQRLGILTDSYVSNAISNLTFTYFIKNGLASDKDRTMLQDLSNKSITSHRFNNMNLPITMEPSEYGEIQVSNFIQTNSESFERFMVINGAKTYLIDRYKSILNLVTNKVSMPGQINLSWVDNQISNNLFKRVIGKSVIYFMDGERVLTKKLLNAKPFTKLNAATSILKYFVTMDIETVLINKNITPYLISAYNGTDKISTYANTNRGVIDVAELFRNFLNSLLTFFDDRKTLYVYAHNLSNFDGRLLLKHLFQFGKVIPIIHNGKLITIKVKLTVEGYVGKTIVFKDSMLLLPSSLRKLSKAFDIDTHKTYFPFNLSNINYTGVFPQFNHWTDISNEQWSELKAAHGRKMWSFKDESIKYCILDCIALHQVLTKFVDLIFTNFKVDAHSTLTAPSLSFKIFKTNYITKNTIFQLLGNAEKAVRLSYTGGAVDAYLPHNKLGIFNNSNEYKKLYYYDVNSLYPFIMANTPMPVGQGKFFKGDIRKVIPDAFGVFYCKITSPEFLLHPILQRKIKTPNGVRTIAGLGSWTGWYNSIELDNALKYGYSFEILSGYQYDKAYIFKDFVTVMSALRSTYSKIHPMHFIAKLLNNSLYGKFGMKPESTLVEIFDTSNTKELQRAIRVIEDNDRLIKDLFKIDNHLITVRDNIDNLTYSEDLDMFHGLDVNVAIASTITAGARVFMSQFKNNPNYNLYYSDTDSIVIDKPLHSNLVGPNIGQLKLEHTIDRAVFLAPKVYALVTVDGQEIIKIKGVSKDIVSKLTFSDLEALLIKDSSREFIQEKWFSKLYEGDITILDVAYTLKVTSNKRKPIYIDGILHSTEPYNYNEIEINN